MNRGVRQRVTAWLVVATVAGMIAMSFAAVPLYREFCQLTGFAGTPRIFAGAPNGEIDRTITVSFNADTGPDLRWTFAPAQGPMTIKLGETALAQFKARNNSDHPIVGKATFNITPFKAAIYFDKIACFCFTEQRLEPGEEVLMPVTFYVDPALASDPATRDVNNVTLSYTFYQADDSPRVSASRDGSEAVN
jgi:cytochrome c oxidase assembly protein subunit 11